MNILTFGKRLLLSSVKSAVALAVVLKKVMANKISLG